MGCDIDFQSREVRDEVIRWGKWYLETTGVDGFRLDAIKHISSWFFLLDRSIRGVFSERFIYGG